MGDRCSASQSLSGSLNSSDDIVDGRCRFREDVREGVEEAAAAALCVAGLSGQVLGGRVVSPSVYDEDLYLRGIYSADAPAADAAGSCLVHVEQLVDEEELEEVDDDEARGADADGAPRALALSRRRAPLTHHPPPPPLSPPRSSKSSRRTSSSSPTSTASARACASRGPARRRWPGSPSAPSS